MPCCGVQHHATLLHIICGASAGYLLSASAKDTHNAAWFAVDQVFRAEMDTITTMMRGYVVRVVVMLCSGEKR